MRSPPGAIVWRRRSIRVPLGPLAHGGGLGDVPPAVALGDVGQRYHALVLEALELLGDRQRHQPAGSDRAPRRREERRPCGGARQQLDRLHRHGDEPEARLAGVEARGVGDDRVDAQAGGLRPRAQDREQPGVAVERGDVVARGRQAQRDAPGAGADVEHPAADARRASSAHSGRSAA